MSIDTTLYRLSERVGQALVARGLMLVTAESCTGGWVGQAITMVPGSSEWYERGYVTYTYISKHEMLGVPLETLKAQGAVSEATARAMAEGALARSHGHLALAITGVAGPAGGTPYKPVGTVCFAWAMRDAATRSETRRFDGERDEVRRQSVLHSLDRVLEILIERG